MKSIRWIAASGLGSVALAAAIMLAQSAEAGDKVFTKTHPWDAFSGAPLSSIGNVAKSVWPSIVKAKVQWMECNYAQAGSDGEGQYCVALELRTNQSLATFIMDDFVLGATTDTDGEEDPDCAMDDSGGVWDYCVLHGPTKMTTQQESDLIDAVDGKWAGVSGKPMIKFHMIKTGPPGGASRIGTYTFTETASDADYAAARKAGTAERAHGEVTE